MSKPKYSITNFDGSCAKAYGKSLPISTKTSIEICSFLRGKSYDFAINYLEDVLKLKKAIPFKRFTNGVGHRKGDMASGRFPQKASTEIKQILESAKANANNKGLSDELKIIHLSAQKASSPFHQGRQRRRMMKKTHIEVVLKEVEGTKKKETKKTAKIESKEIKEPTAKTESKKQQPVSSEAKIEQQAVSGEPKAEIVRDEQ